MSFNASNDRILITDTNGAIAFDTNRDMPHILGVYEFRIKKLFVDDYWDKETFSMVSLPANPDFMICRATVTPYLLEGVEFQRNGQVTVDNNLRHTVGLADHLGQWGKASIFRTYVDGNLYTFPFALGASPGSQVFFQGSMMLESGITNGATKAEAFTAAGNRLVSSPKRAMHVYVEPTWNNKLVVMFEQSECYANNAYDSLTFDGDYLSNGTLVNPRWGYGRTSVRWDVSLKVWAGTFRK